MADNYNFPFYHPRFMPFDRFAGPQAGEPFYNASLLRLDGQPVELAALLDRPLLLETGSVTNPMYASHVAEMNQLARRHPHVRFAVLYVREAHPGKRTPAHRTLADKQRNAARLAREYGEQRTVLVDDLAGTVDRLYGALPNMVYLIDRDGTVLLRLNWNNPNRLRAELAALPQHRLDRRDHIDPAFPSVQLLVSVLRKGGWDAVWDFVRALPQRGREHWRDIQTHRRASKPQASSRANVR